MQQRVSSSRFMKHIYADEIIFENLVYNVMENSYLFYVLYIIYIFLILIVHKTST
jgi:hypothetical protein